MPEHRTLFERLMEAEGAVEDIEEEVGDIIENGFGSYYKYADNWGHNWQDKYYWIELNDMDVKIPDEILKKVGDAIGARISIRKPLSNSGATITNCRIENNTSGGFSAQKEKEAGA